ncbi:MAG: transposase [Dysgonamonadaceae bacterium]|jgi:hypothetical protein|nr:transposase [Dysgonamonadaceae bacterium]
MDLEDFMREFPDGASRKAKFKAFREQAGVACPECGSREHYRKPDKEMYERKHCGYRQGLKTNTAMRKSKLPSRHRFLAGRTELGEALSGRLLAACVSYKNEFRYIYG